MNNIELIEIIKKYTEQQLLDHVMSDPTDLTDSYYSDFRRALSNRYDELVKLRAS